MPTWKNYNMDRRILGKKMFLKNIYKYIKFDNWLAIHSNDINFILFQLLLYQFIINLIIHRFKLFIFLSILQMCISTDIC